MNRNSLSHKTLLLIRVPFVPDTLSALSAGCSLFRKLDLPEDIHFRLRMLAYQRGMKLSECAVKVLDKALPKWNVDRIG